MKKTATGKSAFIGVRVPQDIADRLAAFCEANSTTASEVVRRLLQSSLLTAEEKEAETKARLAEIDAKKRTLEEQAKDVRKYFSSVSLGSTKTLSEKVASQKK
jgi:metal-responsive CopG/Arc/MetJ family transcriptional regulator